MSAELDRVRREVASGRGLPDGAVGFLDGQTLEQIEAQADGLAKVLDRPRQVPPAAPDPITVARAAKTERKRSLVASLAGRPAHRRGRAGRFTSGFDGGARQPIPTPSDPVRDHAELVAQLAYRSKLGGSDPF
jgi:hypothetical protein